MTSLRSQNLLEKIIDRTVSSEEIELFLKEKFEKNTQYSASTRFNINADFTALDTNGIEITCSAYSYVVWKLREISKASQEDPAKARLEAIREILLKCPEQVFEARVLRKQSGVAQSIAAAASVKLDAKSDVKQRPEKKATASSDTAIVATYKNLVEEVKKFDSLDEKQQEELLTRLEQGVKDKAIYLSLSSEIKDEDGLTILHCAIRCKTKAALRLVSCLLDNDADPRVIVPEFKGGPGYNLVEYAAKHASDDIFLFLTKRFPLQLRSKKDNKKVDSKEDLSKGKSFISDKIKNETVSTQVQLLPEKEKKKSIPELLKENSFISVKIKNEALFAQLRIDNPVDEYRMDPKSFFQIFIDGYFVKQNHWYEKEMTSWLKKTLDAALNVGDDRTGNAINILFDVASIKNTDFLNLVIEKYPLNNEEKVKLVLSLEHSKVFTKNEKYEIFYLVQKKYFQSVEDFCITIHKTILEEKSLSKDFIKLNVPHMLQEINEFLRIENKFSHAPAQKAQQAEVVGRLTLCKCILLASYKYGMAKFQASKMTSDNKEETEESKVAKKNDNESIKDFFATSEEIFVRKNINPEKAEVRLAIAAFFYQARMDSQLFSILSYEDIYSRDIKMLEGYSGDIFEAKESKSDNMINEVIKYLANAHNIKITEGNIIQQCEQVLSDLRGRQQALDLFGWSDFNAKTYELLKWYVNSNAYSDDNLVDRAVLHKMITGGKLTAEKESDLDKKLDQLKSIMTHVDAFMKKKQGPFFFSNSFIKGEEKVLIALKSSLEEVVRRIEFAKRVEAKASPKA